MKIRTVVGWALFVAFFVLGNLFILAGFSLEVLPIVYFLFMFLCVIIGLVALRGVFDNRSDIILLLFLGLILCFSASFYVLQVKSYYDVPSLDKSESDLNSEVLAIENQNEVYANYINSQFAQIEQYKNNSEDLLSQIEDKSSSSNQIKDDTISDLEDALDEANSQIEELLDLVDELENREAKIVYVPTYIQKSYEGDGDEDDD